MRVNITEYKKTILDMFQNLTEIEIKSSADTINEDPEKYASAGGGYILAVQRCRQILKIILQDKTNER